MVELYGRQGGEFAVNGNTDQFQGNPAMARLASGEFVIVWTSFVSTGVFEVRGQRYASDGTPIGGDFAVTSLNGNLGHPRVEALSTGGFVVTWTYDLHDGTGTNPAAGTANRIRGQIFDATAAKSGGELALSSGTLVNHTDSQPIALADGGFAVSFTRATSTNNVVDNDVMVQLFDSGGIATGAATLISASSAGSQTTPSLASLAGGRFVATWQDADSSGMGIKAQLFDSVGAKLGREFVVNTVTASHQYHPTVAALVSGGFVITWTHLNSGSGNSSGNDIMGQIFDAAGAKLGGEFLVNTVTSNHQHSAFVTSLSDGGFVVGWRDQSTAGGDVAAQVFDSSGAKQGGQFILNTETEGSQLSVALVGLADGGFVAAWTGSDISGSGVKAQVFGSDAGAPTDLALSTATLNENAVENLAVATLSTTGAVNSGFNYSILSDSTGGAFRIEGDKLVVDDNSRLDFETAPKATLTIRTSDLNGQTYDEVVVLDVTNIGREKRLFAGDEMLVNVNETGSQTGSTVTPLTGGGFAVVWIQYNYDGSPLPEATLLRLYDSAGEPRSGEIQISNKYLSGLSVAPLADGGFVLTREIMNSSTSMVNIRAQRYDSDGNPVGAEMVAGSLAHYATEPVLVQLDTGGFIIAWFVYPGEIQAQRFDSSGTASGAQFMVTNNLSATPISLVATPGGGFAASWIADEDAPGEAMVRFFDSTNAPVRTASVELGDDPGSLSLIALADGGYMLGWRELAGEDQSGLSLQAVMGQRLGADGAAIGERVLLAGYVDHSDSGSVSFAAHPGGGFVATWPAIGGTSVEGGVASIYNNLQGQLFDSSGAPVGPQFQASPMTRGSSDVGVLANGSIAVAWTGSDSDQGGVYARVFGPANEPAGTDGDDELYGDEAPNTLDGGEGDDQLYGLGGDDFLFGGLGDDSIDGGTGDDMMTGGSGNDIYVVDSAADSVVENPGEGVDEIRTPLASYSLLGTNVENLRALSNVAHDFRGNSSNNVITGGAGNDILRLQDGGDDTALGGAGNDGILFGAALSAGDVVDGGEGTRDQLGLQGNYGTFGAGAAAFTLGTNHLVNIEMLVLLSGSDSRFGDSSGSFYSYNIALRDVHVAAGQQFVVSFNTLRVGENVTFDGSAETDGSFMTYGGLGTDILTGGQQSDAFYFGADGRFGAGDRVDGRGGSLDQLGLQGDYSGARAVTFASDSMTGIEMIVLLSAGDSRFGGGSGDGFSYDIVMNDSNVAAGARMYISANALRSDGTLTEILNFDGSAEKDGFFTIYAGSGSDTLVGGERADEIWGRGGADRITGGLGADILRGGEGEDVFDYNFAAESTAASRDSILDFDTGDKIDLSGIDADMIADGDQAFSWIGSNAFSGNGAAGQLRAYQDSASGAWIVEGDVNGDGIADFQIAVSGRPDAPVSSDFIV